MVTKEERIQQLLEKAKTGTITDNERDELARLLDRDPSEFRGNDGLSLLIGIAIGALIGLLFAAILTNND